MTCNYTKHASLRDQFLTIRRRHGLALFWGHIRDLWLIRATGTQCAAYMWHAPDALLICDEHKPVPVGEPIRGFEIVSIAFDEVRLAIAILIPQQRQMPGPLLRNNDIVIGEDEQSARMLQPRDKRRCGEALHHARHLSCIRYEKRSACRHWVAFRRRQAFRFNEKASAQLLIGIAGKICSYGLLGRATLLSNGGKANRPRSRYSNGNHANIVSHQVLPVFFSRSLSRQGDGSNNRGAIAIANQAAAERLR